MPITSHLTPADRYRLAEEHLLRLDGLIDLASATATGAFEHTDGPLENFIDDCADPGMRALHATCRNVGAIVSKCIDGNYEDDIGAELQARGFNGLVARFYSPKRDYTRHAPVEGQETLSFSWGVLHSAWFYGVTYDEIWQRAVQWSKDQDEDARANAGTLAKAGNA